jgi:hypothetical protein
MAIPTSRCPSGNRGGAAAGSVLTSASQRAIAACSNSMSSVSLDGVSFGAVGISPAMMDRIASSNSAFLFWRTRSNRTQPDGLGLSDRLQPGS